MFEFKPVTIDDLELLDPFLKKYGSSSCQHSFPGMLGYKYGDEYCFEDGVLYVHRSKKDYDGFRVYLAPLGDIASDVSPSVRKVLEDAHSHNARASFETATLEFKNLLSSQMDSDLFDVEFAKDCCEYIYCAHSLSALPGRGLAPIRNRVRAFRSAYKGRFRIEAIGASNLESIKRFTERWVHEKIEAGDDTGVENEAKSAFTYLENFERLGFRGVAVYLDGEVVGYAAGLPISDDTADEVLEKGFRNITGIYQLLCNEFAGLFCKEYKYINREEDLGIPGLRQSKERYQPCRMLEKYIIRERAVRFF